MLHLGDLPTQLQQQGWRRIASPHAGGGSRERNEADPVDDAGRSGAEAILGAIRALNGDKLQAAKLLGIGKTTLYRKLKEYGIADPLREE